MPIFETKVKLRGNQVKSLRIQARNQAEARQHAQRIGRVVAFRRVFTVAVNRGMTAADRQIFFARLSSMLSSRVGTSDALQLMRDTFTGKIQEVSGRLLSYVEAGGDLAEAVEQVGAPDFPDATIALIKAGARSGETWRAIKDAAEFEYQLHNVKKGASKGLWVGVGSLLSAGVLAVGSTLYVGPKIMESDLIKAANRDGSVDIGWINTLALSVGWTISTLLFLGFLFWAFASVGRRVIPVMADKIILKIPFYKDLVLARNNFIVLYGLSLLIRSGVRAEEALRLSAEGAPKGALRADLRAAETAVRTGRPWPAAMSTLHPTDKAALTCATDREQVAQTLYTLATQYRELYAQRLASFIPIINLIAALCMTISGGILFGQTILPMLMASEGLLG